MATTLPVQITQQGLIIPRSVFEDWGEVEVVHEKRRIIIRPKELTLSQERELVMQALREDGLLAETTGEPLSPPVTPKERAELAKKLSSGRSLSEIVMEERRAGW